MKYLIFIVVNFNRIRKLSPMKTGFRKLEIGYSDGILWMIA